MKRIKTGITLFSPKTTRRWYALSLGVVGVFSACIPSRGQMLQWDNTPGTAGIQDGAGNWSNLGTLTNWWNGTQNVAWSPGATAVIGNAYGNTSSSAAITLTNPIVAGGLIVSNSYTINSGTVTPTYAIGSGSVATNLTLTGSPASIILAENISNPNNLPGVSGAHVISASVVAPGGLKVASLAKNWQSQISFNNTTNNIQGTLEIGTPGTTDYASATALHVQFNNAGLNAGTLYGCTNIVIHTNASILMRGTTVAYTLPWPKKFVISGDGIPSSAFSFAALNFSGNNGCVFPADIELAGDSTVILTWGVNNAVVTNTGTISGTGRLRLNQSANRPTTGSVVVMKSTNTYVGNTMIDGGLTVVLASGASNRLPGGTSLQLGTNGVYYAANSSSVLQSSYNGYGRLVLGDATGTSDQTVSGLISDTTVNGYQSFVAGGYSAANSVLTVSNSVDNTYLGMLGGANSTSNHLALVKASTGTLYLYGTNLCFGGYTVKSGALVIGNGVADYPLSGPITNNSSVTINVAGSRTFSDPIVGTGMLTKGGNGVLFLNNTTLGCDATISGGTLALTNDTSIASTVNLSLASGTTLDLSGRTTASPVNLNSLSVNNGTISIALASESISATSLAVNGTSNRLQLTSLPYIASFPARVPMIKYTSLTGSLNFAFQGWPAVLTGYTGYLTNDVANHTVDLVLTAGPNSITWSGANGPAWDTGTLNWLDIASNPTNYADKQNVLFADSAATKTVSLSQTVIPLSVTVSNTGATPYVFSDSGAGQSIQAPGFLAKSGAGTVILDNSGTCAFTNGVTVNGGILQFGNNDGYGNLAPTLINDYSLVVIARNNATTFGSSIQGTGGILLQGGGTINLSASNSFAGAVVVTNNTVLKAGNASALGSTAGPTIITSGSTLDVNGLNLGNENVQVSGSGTTGQGAIDNASITQQVNALSSITLLGDTSLGASGTRWDLRSPVPGVANATLSTGGHAYNLNKVGNKQVMLVDATVDPALANVDVQAGTLGVQGATTGLGNPAGTLTVESAGTLFTYALTTPLNKVVSLAGLVQHGNSSATLSGPIDLAGGSSKVTAFSGTTLNLTGPITGSSLTVVPYPGYSTAGTINLSGTNSFTGGLVINQGTVNLNGDNSAVSGLTMLSGGVLSVNGPFGGMLFSSPGTWLYGTGGSTLATVNVSGGFSPGAAANSVGTFIAGSGISFDSAAAITFDLAAVSTTGSNVNDYLIVTNDLTINGNIISVNLLGGYLQTGTYHLIKYTGNLIGTFGGVQVLGASAQNLSLDTSIQGEVNLVVGGSPDTLEWVSSTTNNWDNSSSTNWFSLGGSTNTAFVAGAFVLLDDTPGVKKNIVIGTNVVVIPAGITNNSSANSFYVSGSGSIGGSGRLVKMGDSTLTIGTSNDFFGAAVYGGTLSLSNTYALGRPNVTSVITNSGTLDVGGVNASKYPLVVSGSGVGGNGAIVNNSATVQMNALSNVVMSSDTTLGGLTRWDLRGTSSAKALLGTGGQPYNLAKTGANEIWLVDVAVDPALANIDLQKGKLGVQSTTTMGNPTNTITVSSNATLAFYQLSNVFTKVMVLNDGASLEAANSSNTIGGPVTLNGNCYITGAGTSLTFTNAIGGAGSLVKAETGAQLILSGVNTYAGNTYVAGGNLVLSGNGAISNSALIILSNATMDASRRIDGTLTLAPGQALNTAPSGTLNGSLLTSAGSTVAPGGTGVLGGLTVSGSVTLGGASSIELDAAAHTCDQISCGGTLTYGGALNISIVNGTPANGDTYKLFSAGGYQGSFAVTNLPSLGAGLGWSWNPAAATLSVVPTVNTTPANVVCSVSGKLLTLTWPADHIGWRLQVQTNSLSKGLSTNWVDVAGSSAVNTMAFPVDSSGSVFYRMVY